MSSFPLSINIIVILIITITCGERLTLLIKDRGASGRELFALYQSELVPLDTYSVPRLVGVRGQKLRLLCQEHSRYAVNVMFFQLGISGRHFFSVVFC